jgi:hypothetical protein
MKLACLAVLAGCYTAAAPAPASTTSSTAATLPLKYATWAKLYGAEHAVHDVDYRTLGGRAIAIVDVEWIGNKSHQTDIYIARGTTPVLAGTIGPNWRMHGHIYTLEVSGDRIATRRAEHAESDPECCPSLDKLESWELRGDTLVTTSSSVEPHKQ